MGTMDQLLTHHWVDVQFYLGCRSYEVSEGQSYDIDDARIS